MTYEGMFPLPDYDGGPADRLREMGQKIKETGKADWVEKEYKVVLEEDLIGLESSPVTLEEVIQAGLYSLRASNRIQIEDVECVDGGY